MALSTATVWEIRTTGSQANGGGFFNRVPGTSVDYSQQDAAQLTLTDLATNVAGTGLSSVTGGFTQAMIGNIIHITGGTLTAGWYEITEYTDTNNVTLDRSAGSSKSGGTGNVGGAFAFGGTLDSDFTTALVAGNTIYIKAGAYSLGETLAGQGGTASTRIRWIGYNSARTDSPAGVNRPTIDCGAYQFCSLDYNNIKNIVFTGTAAVVLRLSGMCSAYNCKVTNTSATANRYAVQTFGTGVTLLNCELVSTNGYAMYSDYASVTVLWCYLHDSVYGMKMTANSLLVGSVVDSCSTYGVDYQAVGFFRIVGNTFYGCGTGILGTTGYSGCVLNNIITACTVGAQVNDGCSSNSYWDHNCFYNPAGTDRVYLAASDNDVDADPLLTDPSNGDFTLGTGSPCFASGMALDASVGL